MGYEGRINTDLTLQPCYGNGVSIAKECNTYGLPETCYKKILRNFNNLLNLYQLRR